MAGEHDGLVIAAALVSGGGKQGQPGGLDVRGLARRDGPSERECGRSQRRGGALETCCLRQLGLILC